MHALMQNSNIATNVKYIDESYIQWRVVYMSITPAMNFVCGWNFSILLTGKLLVYN